MDASRAQISVLTYKIYQLQLQNQIIRQSQSTDFTFKPQSVEQLLYEKQSYDSVIAVTRQELYASLLMYEYQQYQINSDQQIKDDMMATNEQMAKKIDSLMAQVYKSDQEIAETKLQNSKLCGECSKQKSIAEALQKEKEVYQEYQKQMKQELDERTAYNKQLQAGFEELQRAFQEVIEEKDSLLAMKKMFDDIIKTRKLDCETAQEHQEARDIQSTAQLSVMRSSGLERRPSGTAYRRSGQIRSGGAGSYYFSPGCSDHII